MNAIDNLIAIHAKRTVTGSIYEAPHPAPKPKAPRNSPCYMLIVGEGPFRECDQIVSTEREAKRERRDLIAMDCGKVTIKRFDTWEAAYAYEDKLRGY